MEALQHIKLLLRDHDRAFIPGFGGFVKERTPAWLDRSADRFHPPGCTILFNRRLGKEDGQLAERLMNEEGLSFEKAREDVRQLAREWEHGLEVRKRLELEGIGILFKDEEGKTRFEPDPDPGLEPSCYGLKSFFVEPVLSKAEENPEAGTADRELQEEQEEGPVEAESEEEDSVEIERIPFGKIAAVLIPLILLGSFALFRFQGGNEKGLFSEFLIGRFGGDPLYEPREELPSLEVPFKPLQGQEEEPPFRFSLSEKGKSYTVIDKEDRSSMRGLRAEAYASYYFVIGGCFAEKGNAETRKSWLEKKGYPARILERKRKGLHVVIFDHYKARQEALEGLRRAKGTMRDAWLIHGSAL